MLFPMWLKYHYGDGRILYTAVELFPDATNAIFRAYRYPPDEVPWLP